MKKSSTERLFPFYDVAIIVLLLTIGFALIFAGGENKFVALAAGALIGAGLGNVFSSLLTNRIEISIEKSIKRFDQAVDLAQFKIPGIKEIPEEVRTLRYQYFKTTKSDGSTTWSMVLYEWQEKSTSYIALGKCKSFDSTGHSNTYSSTMMVVRDSLIVFDVDEGSGEGVSVNIIRRGVGNSVLYGVAKSIDWGGRNTVGPIIQSSTPVCNWDDPAKPGSKDALVELEGLWTANSRHTSLLSNQSE